MTQVQKKIFLTLVLGCLSATALPQDGYGVGGGSSGGGSTPAPAPSNPGSGPTPDLDKIILDDVDAPAKYDEVMTKAFSTSSVYKEQWRKRKSEAKYEMHSRRDTIGADCKSGKAHKIFTDPTLAGCLTRPGNPNLTTKFLKEMRDYMEKPTKDKKKVDAYYFCPHLVHILLSNLTTQSSKLRLNVASRQLNAQTLFAEVAFKCGKDLHKWFYEPPAGQ